MKFMRFTLEEIRDSRGIQLSEIATGYEYKILLKIRNQRICSIAMTGGMLGSRLVYSENSFGPTYHGDQVNEMSRKNELFFQELGITMLNGEDIFMPVGKTGIHIRNYVLEPLTEEESKNLAAEDDEEDSEDNEDSDD